MKGFVYNGKSTEDILSVPLMLATFDSIESVVGVNKNDNIGNQTITRETPNEYGTINTLPTFTYGLIKTDKSVFTNEEQRIVEAWLTSSRFSKELYMFDWGHTIASMGNDINFQYNGEQLSSASDVLSQEISFSYDDRGNLISETDWEGNVISYTYDSDDKLISKTDNNGVTSYLYDGDNLINIVFPNGEACYYEYDDKGRVIHAIESNYENRNTVAVENQNYYYKGRFTETEWYIAANGWAGIMFTFTCATAYPYQKYSHSYDISDNTSFKIVCQSDEKESYVYPTITFENKTTSGLVNDFNFSLINKNDNNQEMKVKVQSGITLALDCQNCIPWKYLISDNNGTRQECLYSELGWNDVGHIYWARLLPGMNEFTAKGNGKITIKYNAPYKKVGGWL